MPSVLLWVVVLCCSCLLLVGCALSPTGARRYHASPRTAIPAGASFVSCLPRSVSLLTKRRPSSIPGTARPHSAMLLPCVCQCPRALPSPSPSGPRTWPAIASYHAGPTMCWLTPCPTLRHWGSTALARPGRYCHAALAQQRRGCHLRAGGDPEWLGPGTLLAHGAVTPEVEQRTAITGKALRPGENQLWLRVKDAAGAEASTGLE